MDNQPAARSLSRLGAALLYPRPGGREALETLCAGLALCDPTASQMIRRFLAATAGLTDCDLAETYTRTFDLAPHCAPYLGVHLFGEQDARRAKLLVGLAEEFAQVGVDVGSELPDHVAVVLQALEKMPAERSAELCSLCLLPALASMHKQLESCDNPYAHLLGAVARLTRTSADGASPAERAHA